MKYIAADERSGNGDPGEADLELWIVTDYVEKGTSLFYLDSGHRQGSTDQKMDGSPKFLKKWSEGDRRTFLKNGRRGLAKILKTRTDEMKNLNHR